MAWIESHQSLMSHHKTRKAARLLGVKPVHLIGHLHALWWWALDYADDGDVTRFDAEDIADAAQWEDDAGELVEALTACGPGDAPGFLERTDDGRLVIHDWWDYAGKLVERRRADAERKRSSRHPESVQRTSSGHPADGAQSPYVTVTNSNPNQPTNQTNPSQNADEQRETPQKAVSVSPSFSPSVSVPPSPSEESVSHETARKRAPKQPRETRETTSEPYLVWAAGCEIAGVSIQDAEGTKSKQLGFIANLLKHHPRDDLLTCFAWLWDDPFEKQRGVDWKRVDDRIASWINKGKPPPRRIQQESRTEYREVAPGTGVYAYVDR